MSRAIKHIYSLNKGDRKVGLASLMIFFFVLFDGVLMYAAPIVMTHNKLSAGTVGLILGLSSVAGMAFDIIMSRLIKDMTYRSIFFFMLVVAAVYPFVLFGANSVTVYLMAMVIWGLYYNLYNVGTLDFVSRSGDDVDETHTDIDTAHAREFGVLKVFDGLGYMIAPLLGSVLIINMLNGDHSRYLMLALILPAFSFFFLLINYHKHKSKVSHFSRHIHRLLIHKGESFNFLKEMSIWMLVMKSLMPVLLLTLIINMVDSAMWTVGPLYSESLGGGYFMLAYTIPPLLVGWVTGRVASRWGKRHTAIIALFIGSILMSGIGLTSVLPLLYAMSFAVSMCYSLAWPIINSIYADNINRDESIHEETESIEDLFTNIGDVLGPIIAGYSAQYAGSHHTFIYVGAIGVLCSAMLLFLKKDTL